MEIARAAPGWFTEAPSYFPSIGLPLEERLLADLDRHGWDSPDAPVFIQSFETNLKELRARTPVKLIQLLQNTMPTDDDLRDIKTYADGIGPHARLVVPANQDGTLKAPTDLILRAHKAGLLVHVWTLRSEAAFLSPSYGGRAEAEFWQFRDLGADGMFTDFPDVGVQALRGGTR